MINGKTVMVVMPAYKAGKTLAITYAGLPKSVVDFVLVVDDASDDDTVAVARALGIEVRIHPRNRGYGGNQKTCYAEALSSAADIIVMVHPDYQYEPKLVTAMAAMIESGVYDCVLGSRILCGGALRGGMPLWKYIANRCLTAIENLLLGAKLSEYHSGYRAYSRALLETLPWQQNSDDFIFDNQFLSQVILGKWNVGEISVPTKYFAEASSIGFLRSCRYGFGVLNVSLRGALARLKVLNPPTCVKPGKNDASP